MTMLSDTMSLFAKLANESRIACIFREYEASNRRWVNGATTTCYAFSYYYLVRCSSQLRVRFTA